MTDSMPTLRQRPTPALRLVAVAAMSAALVLSGCAADTDTDPGPSASGPGIPGPSESPGGSPTPSASEAPDAADPSTPVGLTCEQLVTLQELYDFNPNVAHTSGTPEAGSLAALAVEADGVACHLQNLSSNEIIVVAAATPGASTLAAIRADLDATAAPADGLGGDGWFGGTTATVISGEHLVTVSSPFFVEAADAAPLVAAALAKLG